MPRPALTCDDPARLCDTQPGLPSGRHFRFTGVPKPKLARQVAVEYLFMPWARDLRRYSGETGQHVEGGTLGAMLVGKVGSTVSG